MLLYRLAWHDNADLIEPRHEHQGGGRFDNPDVYTVSYLGADPTTAIAETLQGFNHWTADTLRHPKGWHRVLAVYEIDHERYPVLDLDDPNALAERALTPSSVVARNRPRTQAIARKIWEERAHDGSRRWSGLRWWSLVHPDLRPVAIWQIEDLALRSVASPLSAEFLGAAALLSRTVADDVAAACGRRIAEARTNISES